jgi:hypothetical protein
LSAVIIDLRTRQHIPSGSLPEQPRDEQTAARQAQIAVAAKQVRAIYGSQHGLHSALRWYGRHDNDTPPSAA